MLSIPAAAPDGSGRKCNSCQRTKSSRWYKDPADSTKDRCKACYQKALVQRANKTCSSCQGTKSSNWYKDPADSTKDRCSSCYQKVLAQRANKTCSSCQGTKAPRWHKDPADSTKDRCASCYQKDRKSALSSSSTSIPNKSTSNPLSSPFSISVMTEPVETNSSGSAMLEVAQVLLSFSNERALKRRKTS
ncbi:MAG TPA: hypothetical protein VLE89_02595 [Chlamydiales bacterium]|nr:hypothetical protein [Chlamydiales bacterium]